MVEGKWHKKIMKEIKEEYGDRVSSSHGKSSISLFNGRISKKKLISNPDIIVFKDKSKRIIEKIIEVEDSANPKTLMADVFVTRLANTYKSEEGRHKVKRYKDLHNFQLIIIYNSNKDKLDKIKHFENEIKKKWKNLNFKFEAKR